MKALDALLNGKTRWTFPEAQERPLSSEAIEALLFTFSQGNYGQVVKESNTRLVLRLPSQNSHDKTEAWIAKIYYGKGLRNFLKETFTTPRAVREWQMGLALSQRGISVVEPLALGQRRLWSHPALFCLLTREVQGAMDLEPFIKQRCQEGPQAAEKKKEVLRQLASLVRALHHNGISYPDLHSGNILVREEQGGHIALYLIDLHNVSLPWRLSRRARLQALGKLFFSLEAVLCPEETLEFLRLYGLGEELGEKTLPSLNERLLHLATRLKERRWRSRTKRCLKESSSFHRKKTSHLTLYYRKGLNEASLLRLMDATPEQGPLKETPRATTTIKNLDDRRVCVKHERSLSLWDALTGGRGRKAWVRAHGLLVRGLPTPLPMALMERKTFGLLVQESFLITEYVENSLSYDFFIHERLSRESPAGKRRFIRSFASLISTLHHRGIYHHDLKGKNILVREGGPEGWELFFIDLDKLSFGRSVSKRRRAKNLAQIDASTPRVMTRTDKLRFLLLYLNQKKLDKEAKDFIREVMAFSAKRKRYWPAL